MNMIDDPEAFYFYDKVQMRSNSVNVKKIPILNFNKVDEANQQENQLKQQIKKDEEKKLFKVHFNFKFKEIKKNEDQSDLNISQIKDANNIYSN